MGEGSFLTTIDLEKTAAGLRHIFPDLPNFSCPKLLGDGFSSYVILIANEIVFRFAKHPEAMKAHTRELAILSRLQNRLSVQIPAPTWSAGPSEFFPFGVIGYPIITGIPFFLDRISQVNLKRVGQDLAEFLIALHETAPDVVFDYNPGEMLPIDINALRAGIMPTLHSYFSTDDYRRITAWWDSYLTHSAQICVPPKLIHGDLWGENIILNERLDRVVGIIDFEAARMGDVAQDFMTQTYVSVHFMNQVLAVYQTLGGQVGCHFTRRLQDLLLLRELQGLHYALQYPQSEELGDSLQKIRRVLDLGF